MLLWGSFGNQSTWLFEEFSDWPLTRVINELLSFKNGCKLIDS